MLSTRPPLNQGQQAAADGFFDFLFSNDKELIISGPGGVGKSFLMGYLIDEIMPRYEKMCSLLNQPAKYHDVHMTATTNKAAEVLAQDRAHTSIQNTGTKAPDATLWPTWLLRPPRRLAVQGNRPCHHGVLRLLAGPHRFEAGWWSAEDEGAGDPGNACAGLALRDYFVAHNDVAGLVWVFRERLAPQPGGAVQKDATQKDATQKGAMAATQPHRWFLHGIFG